MNVVVDLGFYLGGILTAGLTVVAVNYRKLRRVKALLGERKSLDLSKFTAPEE